MKKDDDLNKLVFKYYDEKVNAATYKGANYVSTDTLAARRSVAIDTPFRETSHICVRLGTNF